MHRRSVKLFNWLMTVLMLSTALPIPGIVQASELGPTQRAVVMNGTDSYLEVADAPQLTPDSGMTIEAWVYRNDADRCETVVGKGSQTSYWLGFCTAKLRFYTRGVNTSIDSVATIPAGIWTHIAVTYDGATRRYYINGALDTESTLLNGPIVDNTAPLGIGYDPASAGVFQPNFFRGRMDEVRLWSVVRTQAEIAQDMHAEIYAQGGLVASWRLNGSPENLLVGHSGIPRGQVRYETDGVLPYHMAAPSTATMPAVDANCNSSEYGSVERIGLRRDGVSQIYITHTDTDLYVCAEGLAQGADRSVALTLDRDYSREASATAQDYRFVLSRTGATLTQAGNGLGGFQPATLPAGAWQGAAQDDLEFTWRGEFRISKSLWIESELDTIGLAIFEQGASLDDNQWPITAVSQSPQTWAGISFAGPAASIPRHDFSGKVVDTAGAGIANAQIQLFAWSSAGSSLLRITRTNSAGNFGFSYRGYAAGFHVQEIDSPGYFSISADAGVDGSGTSSPNSVTYRAKSTGSYSPVTFLDSSDPFDRPTARPFDRYYVIVYGAPVTRSDLWPLIEMKQRQGFQVSTVTTQTIAATVEGRDLAEKIRNWLKSQWQLRDPAPVYALLVGRGDVIPVRDYGGEGTRTIRLGEPGYVPLIQTDWYYADLDSNWDIDGDNFYGEFLYCTPGERTVPNPADPGNLLPCPPADDPQRDGPYGTLPGPEDDWVPEISLGRLALNEPALVRHALQTSVANEASGSPDKRNSLLAGSFWSYYGRSWREATPGNPAGYDGSDFWISNVWRPEKPWGDDTAEHFDVKLKPILQGNGMNVTRLYESTSPNNDPTLNPSRFTPDWPLRQEKFYERWQAQGHGLINLAGHGSANTVASARWAYDYNGSRQIEQPANPAESDNCPTWGCYELAGEDFIHRDSTPVPGGEVAPIVFARSCSTGQIGWDCNGSCVPGFWAFPSTLAGQGKIAAWIGAQSTHTTHATEDLQDQFNREILETPLRLGDALWKSNRDYVNHELTPLWTGINLQLYGDPAYSYWGNPADMRAYWPQSGRDWGGTQTTFASGPSAGQRLWTTAAQQPLSSPVVDGDGNIWLAGRNAVMQYAPNGAVLQQIALNAPTSFMPALASDGIHVLTQNASDAAAVHLYDRTLQERPAVNLDAQVTGAVRIGPDGIIWVPTSRGMARVLANGKVNYLGSASATSPAVFLPNGAIAWTTEDGALRISQMDRYGASRDSQLNVSSPLFAASTAPAVGVSGDIFVGNGPDFVARVSPSADAIVWSWSPGSPLTTAPAVLGNTSFVGTTQGVTGFSADGAVQWTTRLAGGAAATPTLDHNRLYVTAGSSLHALELNSGERLWSVDLGDTVDERSVPVIGANHTIYVTTQNGRLVAVAETNRLIPPSDVRIETGARNATIRWRDNSAEESAFRIERCIFEGSCTEVAIVDADITSFEASNLPAGEAMIFRIQAVGSNDVVQNASNAAMEVTAVTESSDYAYSTAVVVAPAAPAAPANLAAVPESATAIQLDWAYGADTTQLTGFELLRSEQSDGEYAKVGMAGPTELQIVDQELQPGTTYYYKLQTHNDGGKSSLVGPVSATTKPQSLPAPTLFTVSNAPLTMQLSWKDNATTEDGYVIERRPPGVGAFEPLTVLPANATEFGDSYLLIDGVYEYRVKAVAASAESPYATMTGQYPQPAGDVGEDQFLPLIMR